MGADYGRSWAGAGERESSGLNMRFRKRTDGDFRDEIEAHLRLEMDRLAAEGLSPAEAEAAARRAFGNTPALKNTSMNRGAGYGRSSSGWICGTDGGICGKRLPLRPRLR